MSTFSEHAKIIPAGFDDGWILELDGDVQSHVDLVDPSVIRFEYLHRIANVIDVCWPATQPIKVLHLGAGALTLPRYIQATRPGSHQTVVELDPRLIPLVVDELPLPEGTHLDVVTGDARAQVQAMETHYFDAVVVDIFTGGDTAAHLTGEDFYRELIDRLAPQGVLLVNIGEDEDGLQFFTAQARALHTVAREFQGAWTLADASTLVQRSPGNAVVAAGGGLPIDDDAQEVLRSRLAAAGPHPATVLTPSDTVSLLENLNG